MSGEDFLYCAQSRRYRAISHHIARYRCISLHIGNIEQFSLISVLKLRGETTSGPLPASILWGASSTMRARSFSSTLNSIPSNSYFLDYRTIQIETSQIEWFLDLVNFAKNALSQKKALSLLPQVNGNLYNIIPGKKRRGQEKQSEIKTFVAILVP